jgi:lipopolysaccharide transport system permease protein
MATMLVFLFAFKNVANIKDFSGYPIQLVIFSGILFWNYFANGFQSISQSILINGNLISKVYFPRLIICISSLAVTLVDFFVGLLVYLLLLLGLHQPISETIIYLPLALLITTIFSLGLGLIFASFAVKYRDLLQAIPLIVQYGFFVTPIEYTSNVFITKSWYPLYSILNPLASFVLQEGVQISLKHGYSNDPDLLTTVFNFRILTLKWEKTFIISTIIPNLSFNIKFKVTSFNFSSFQLKAIF